MITLPYQPYADQIHAYFRENVFIVGSGPDYFAWLLENYKATLVSISIGVWQLQFKDEFDAAMFVLRWQ